MKRILKIVSIVVGLFIGSVIIVALLVDANMFKPRIVSLAKDKGVALDMRGDLHWAFWPSIGLAANDLHIASSNLPTTSIAQIQKASFLIALVPLLQGDFQVKHILVESAVIHLVVNEQGKGNWEDLLDAQKSKSPIDQPLKNADDAVSGNDLAFQIEKISVHHGAIHYTDAAKQQHIVLTEIDVDVDDVNTQGNPFDLTFAWVAQWAEANSKTTPLIVKGKLHNTITLGAGFNSVSINDGKLTLDISKKSTIALTLKYSAKVDNLKNNLRYEGQFVLPSFSAKQLLAVLGTSLKTADEKALSDVGVASKFNGDKKHIQFNVTKLTLDKTQMNGSAAGVTFANSGFQLKLQGDQINVDDYLAPAVEKEASATIPAATGDEIILPLESLRTLNAEITASFKSIIFSAMALEKVRFDVEANNGVVKQLLNANIYGGSIHESSTIDARGATAQLHFEAIVKNIELAPVLAAKKLDKTLKLSGAIQTNANGQASGISMNKIMDSLTGSANFSGAKVRLAPLNIEQQFCQFVNLVNKVEAPEKAWDAFTEMTELSGKVTIAKRVITIETFNAGVEKLALNATGKVNLFNKEYDFLLPLKLIKDTAEPETNITTSTEGCRVGSNFWAERGMSLLRCKGSFGKMNPAQDCRPDKNALTVLTKDYAEYKLREKHGEKMNAKKSEALKKLDDKLGGDGSTEKAKALLKDIFKKRDE